MINIEKMVQMTDSKGNWNLFYDGKIIYSIAIVKGCKDSYFGDVKYLVSIIYKHGWYKIEDFTNEGIEILESHLKNIGYKLSDLFK